MVSTNAVTQSYTQLLLVTVILVTLGVILDNFTDIV